LFVALVQLAVMTRGRAWCSTTEGTFNGTTALFVFALFFTHSTEPVPCLEAIKEYRLFVHLDHQQEIEKITKH
jgi:hypothetical protein